MLPEALSHYRIVEKLGEGGMGVIYRAVDTRLQRTVVLKTIRGDALTDPERRARFKREARAASALNHPNIVTIYEIDRAGEVDFIVMEHVDGDSLQTKLAGDQLPIDDAVRYGRGVAEALAEAHAHGVVHRDIKPANVMLTRSGVVKVLDFGLAKLTVTETDLEAPTRSRELRTKQGMVLGTVAYMSPEQAEGRPVDARSDVFSFGVLLFELMCGERPFDAPSVASLLSAILRDPPPAPTSLRPDVPAELARIVLRCLEKDPALRYADAGKALDDLRRLEGQSRPFSIRLSGRSLAAGALGLLLTAAAVAGWLWLSGSDERWVREHALPEIDRLADAGALYDAYRLGRQADERLPGDPGVRERLDRFTLPMSFATEPAGARVFVKDYEAPEDPWELLGTTPLQTRIPYVLVRLRIEKQGFEPFDGAPYGVGPFTAFMSGWPLAATGTQPPGMGWVPGGVFRLMGFQSATVPTVEVGAFWLDRFEITNRQFKEFVNQGGYSRREHWPEIVDVDGRPLSWEEGMASFADTTGRPGPATWEAGSFDDGAEDLPVGGVSWYEAAAYCSSVGKSLPTLYHWYRGTAQDQHSNMLNFSNLGTAGPVAVGSLHGVADYGSYDMAGNVREWCSNADEAGRRYSLGGAWDDPHYMFRNLRTEPPLDRSPPQGFRCVQYEEAPTEELLAPMTPARDLTTPQPVSDDVFEVFRGLYNYDRTELDARVENVDDDSPHWRREAVSFRAAYGDERVTALLFLPRDVAPPYQTVVWFPGDDVYFQRSSESLAGSYLFDFLPRSGRALVYPIYYGMYERHVPFSFAPHEWRDMMIRWSKDLGRTLDYLETRPDVDAKRLAYYGFSSGAWYGPVLTAIDDRFRASVLLAGGLPPDNVWKPEMDLVNFASRSRVPTLMINGRDDYLMPLEYSQRPLFELLGAAEGDKRHAVLDGGHIPPDSRLMMREILDWLDRQLGPMGASQADEAQREAPGGPGD